MMNMKPNPADELETDLLKVSEIALAHSATLGASMAETSVGHANGISITVRNGEVETVEHHRDKSLSTTVYFGHRIGNSSTTDFAEQAIQQSVASACSIAKFTEEDECNGLAERDLLATEFLDLDLLHPWQPQKETAIELAAECEHAAISQDPRISNTEGATISCYQGVDLYANSNGFSGFSRGSEHSIGCTVIAGQSDAMQRDYWYDCARDWADLQTPKHIGSMAGQRTIRRLGAQKARTGEYPIILEASVAASMLSHLVNAISGPSLYRKASFLLDHLDKQIFPESIRIHEQPHLPKSIGAANFDSEGVATNARDIVADGILRGYVLGSYSARKLGTRTTGNAGGVHNLEIQATSNDGLEGLIRQMGRGLVIGELIGHGVNTVTGDYSRGAFGFWVENGEIQYPVQEFTIAGNLTRMFLDIAAVGADTDVRGNLRSGSILIEKMTVAGT